MRRAYLEKLIHWKSKHDRKPLILRGVRQVGKTYLLKHFGNEYFPAVHYLNFEKDSQLAKIFEQNLDPQRIVSEIELYLSRKINKEKDLVIFDEIQICPRALTSLKYFQEEMPELALASAGSLLGIYLGPVSFPVGKVDILTLYPMSFEEFLIAVDEKNSKLEFLQELEGTIIPVEVKSGWVTQAKSLKVFKERYHPPYSIIFSAKNLSINDAKDLIRSPLYLANQLFKS